MSPAPSPLLRPARAVSLAGIASIQEKCTPEWELAGINGFSAGLPCMTLFRYYW